MKKSLSAIAAVIILISCGTSTTTSEKKTDSLAVASQQEVKQLWEYSTDVDKMTSDSNYYTVCTSTNELEFDFPYQGGQKTFITIRKKGKDASEVIVNVAKGQFMTSVMNDEPIKIKFDDGKPETFYYHGASSGNSDVIFISSPKKLINKLLTAKKVMMEAEFYSAGNKVMEFDVAGLKWKH
jgi:hypothetical protein